MERQWLLIKERLKLKDHHSKIMTDFEWKVENWRIHQTNLRKSTHRVHIHETLKNSRIPVYTRIRMRYFLNFYRKYEVFTTGLGSALAR